jgi:hypothetical protein
MQTHWFADRFKTLLWGNKSEIPLPQLGSGFISSTTMLSLGNNK